MDALKQRIRDEAIVLKGNLIKVDRFLNHQLDVRLINQMGEAFKQHFFSTKVDKILTIEASGIAIAAITAQYFDVPVVFAKKAGSRIQVDSVYSTIIHSYTKNSDATVVVSKPFLNPGERILIIDDFLAEGQAVKGLLELIKQADATCVGVGIAIEKGFQHGGKELRSMGINLFSLAIIAEITPDGIKFD